MVNRPETRFQINRFEEPFRFSKKIVFFAHPSPKAKAEKDHAWAQKYDQKKLVDYLKKGSKALMSAISHRNTVTKDTFMLTGFSDALLELEKRCKLN